MKHILIDCRLWDLRALLIRNTGESELTHELRYLLVEHLWEETNIPLRDWLGKQRG